MSGECVDFVDEVVSECIDFVIEVVECCRHIAGKFVNLVI